MATANEMSYFAPIVASTGKEAALDLQELYLTGTLLPIGARLNVLHRFRSSESEPIEIIYTFALPRDAALIKFLVKCEGFTAHSELHPVEEAEKKYEEGIEKGNLSVMTRNYRDGKVNLMVGNVRPGEEVMVILEIISGVETNDNGFSFKFPFTLSPVYHPLARSVEIEPGVGQQMLPENIFGDLILPSFAKDASNLHKIGFNLDFDENYKISEIASPSHSITFSLGQNEKKPFVSLARDSALPNNDLTINVKTTLDMPLTFTGIDENHKGKGHFVSIIPSSTFGEFEKKPQQIVFIIDRSASMKGHKIAQVKKAILECLKTLSEEDDFNIIAFDSSLELFKDGLVSASPNLVQEAKEFVEKIISRGGTEMMAALTDAIKILSDRKGGHIFILTDGEVGETEQIIQQVKNSGIKIHCLGIGSTSQDRFLTLLARETSGTSRFLSPQEKIVDAAREMFSSISTPVATDVSVMIKGDYAGRIDPKPARNVYKDNPIIVFGETTKAGKNTLEIHYKESDSAVEIPFEIADGRHLETIRYLHGARLITDLESEYNTASSNYASAEEKLRLKRIEKRLERLSRKYNLASRRMSLVAVVERENDQDGSIPKTKIVKVGMPEDTSYESYFKLDPSMVCFSMPFQQTMITDDSYDSYDSYLDTECCYRIADDYDISPRANQSEAPILPRIFQQDKRLNRIDVLINLGLLDKALDNINVLLENDPYNKKLHLLLKSIYAEKGDTNKVAAEAILLAQISEIEKIEISAGEHLVTSALANIETYAAYLNTNLQNTQYSDLKNIAELFLTLFLALIEMLDHSIKPEYQKAYSRLMEIIETLVLPLIDNNDKNLGDSLNIILKALKEDAPKCRNIIKDKIQRAKQSKIQKLDKLMDYEITSFFSHQSENSIKAEQSEIEKLHPRTLLAELEEVDFYIANEFFEEAKAKIKDLHFKHPDHDGVKERVKILAEKSIVSNLVEADSLSATNSLYIMRGKTVWDQINECAQILKQENMGGDC